MRPCRAALALVALMGLAGGASGQLAPPSFVEAIINRSAVVDRGKGYAAPDGGAAPSAPAKPGGHTHQ